MCVGVTGHPYCQFTNVDDVFGFNGKNVRSSPASYVCVQCVSSCDCPIGQYCQTDPHIQTNLYTCESYQSVIGQSCNAQAQISNPGTGKNDDLLPYKSSVICGIQSSYLNTATNVTHYDLVYKAQCIQGICKECNGFAIYNGGCYTCETRYCAGTNSLGPIRYCATGGHYFVQVNVDLNN